MNRKVIVCTKDSNNKLLFMTTFNMDKKNVSSNFTEDIEKSINLSKYTPSNVNAIQRLISESDIDTEFRVIKIPDTNSMRLYIKRFYKSNTDFRTANKLDLAIVNYYHNCLMINSIEEKLVFVDDVKNLLQFDNENKYNRRKIDIKEKKLIDLSDGPIYSLRLKSRYTKEAINKINNKLKTHKDRLKSIVERINKGNSVIVENVKISEALYLRNSLISLDFDIEVFKNVKREDIKRSIYHV
jgi:hypothetical protein